jgi:uncharacterized tellurite resistance protein B-like protein
MEAPFDAELDPELITVLSELSEEPITPEQVTATTLFFAALTVVLSGVIMMDGVVAQEEEERMQGLIHSFFPPEDPLNAFIQRLLHSIEQQQVYLDPQRMLTLVQPLSNAQRLMLLGLGYEMSAADNDVNTREVMYLRGIASRLGIPQPYIDTLEIGFTRTGKHDPDVLVELAQALAPQSFEHLDPVFMDMARSILIALPTTPEENRLLDVE